MVDIRQATMYDAPLIGSCNFLCFPEEYPCDSTGYGAHYKPQYEACIETYIALWPRLVYVAEDQATGRILGYVVAKMEGKGTERHGYISHLGVRPTHRKLGIAKKLMTAAQNAMVQEYNSEYASLHVRTSSLAAINLYTKVLGYKTQETAAECYDNGEDAYVMRKQLPQKQPSHVRQGFTTHGGGCFSSEANAKLQGLPERVQLF